MRRQLVAMAVLGAASQVWSQQPVAQEARAVELVPTQAVIDGQVLGTDGKKIGEVDDLVIARERGRVVFVLLGHGGVLSIGEKVTAAPYAAFTWDGRERSLKLPMMAERLKSAPTLAAGEWAKLADAAEAGPISKFFGKEETGEPGKATEGGSSKLSPSQFPVMKVSELKGKPVGGSDGAQLATVNELVLDVNSGRLAFVVLTFGGVAGVGEERVPVPWPVFDVNEEGRLFAADLNKDMLRKAPHLLGKEWDELKTEGFGRNVFDHFGKGTLWLVPDPPTPAVAAYEKLCAGGLPTVVSGKVESVEELPPLKDVPPVVIVMVKAGAGDATKVHLGPRSYMDGEGLGVKVGDTIAVKGREARVDGRPCVIATEITPEGGKATPIRRGDGGGMWTRK